MVEDESKKLEDDDEIIMMSDFDEDADETEENSEESDGENVVEDDDASTGEDTETDSEPDAEQVAQKEVTEKTVTKESKEKKSKKGKKDTSKDDKPKDSEIEKAASDKPDGKLKKLWRKIVNNKKRSIPIIIALLLLVVIALPQTRYTVLGFFIKKNVTVRVVDTKTNKPVSESNVEIAGKSAKTDGNGVATVNSVLVGRNKVKIEKTHYKTYEENVLVPITKKADINVSLESTGRQVPITITNTIDGSFVKGAVITSGDSSASTDNRGQTTLVLPPNSQSEMATIKIDNYNDKEVNVTVTDSEVDENKFTITPKGRVYFLSKLSGKLDVVRTNLDGSDRQTVLAGTGNEDDFGTMLVGSRDWRYLALNAKRDDKNKLYLIDTSDDSLSVIDEGDASFSPMGWYNEYFVFTLVRNNVQYWQSKKSALKSFSAESKKLSTLDETLGEGSSDIDYASEQLFDAVILNNEVLYIKTWQSDYYSGGKIIGKKNTINSIKPNGSDRKVIREFEITDGNRAFIVANKHKPQEVYFSVNDVSGDRFYVYENGRLSEDSKLRLEDVQSPYPVYAISPSGVKTLWYENRDGKNAILVGNRDADDSRQIIDKSEYTVIGWFTDEYILLSKNGSELYIASLSAPENVLKISDYHQTRNSDIGGGYSYVVK